MGFTLLAGLEAGEAEACTVIIPNTLEMAHHSAGPSFFRIDPDFGKSRHQRELDVSAFACSIANVRNIFAVAMMWSVISCATCCAELCSPITVGVSRMMF